ncbi:MAG: electron transfer flavoprotein subunit beta/FixA family protein [Thermoplasmata archaeon]|jgi:electron transfer flavoprotein beta subunit|nr:electron transfer flavoprotein subunit beta/FixA family protein [Thermoplasmatales archaeon]PMP74919.1 MAG: electron transfer flavoprotein subunit beta [Aciduliprofundum sp.]
MYNIIVCFKQILDIDQMKIDEKTQEPITKNLPYRLEDLSKNAIEEAVRIKEKHGGKVIGITFGGEQATLAMKEALAMGVDEGIILKGYKENNPELTSEVLAKKISTLKYDIVIMGNASADSYTGLVPGKVARKLNIPILGNAIKLELQENVARITRSMEDVNYIVESKLPALITVEQEINEPRLPPLIQIMAAGRKPMKVEEIQVNVQSSKRVIYNKAPKSDRKRIIFEDIDKGVEEVTRFLRSEAK